MKIKFFCIFFLLAAIFNTTAGAGLLLFLKKPLYISASLSAKNLHFNEEEKKLDCQFLLTWNDSKWSSIQVINKIKTIRNAETMNEILYNNKEFKVYDNQNLEMIDNLPVCNLKPLNLLLKIGDERVLIYLISKIFRN